MVLFKKEQFFLRVSLFCLVTIGTEYYAVGQFTSQDINNFIAEFQQQLQNEIDATPKTIRYNMTLKPMSINAAVELSAEIQRTFEYVAEQTNMPNLQGAELDQLQQALDGSSSYQDLLRRCEDSHPDPQCDENSPYRTYDGTCNNQQNPRWGSLLYPERRQIPQQYEGLSGFRQSVGGGPLPEPRTLSLNIMPNRNRPTEHLSHMFTFYGQLLSHDISDTPVNKVNGLTVPCCVPNGFNYPECSKINVPADDPFYSIFKLTCFSFIRNAPYSSCMFSKREPMNSVPVFIDAHFTYGRTEAEARDLKLNDESGRLVIQQSEYGDLMPPNISEDDAFCRASNINDCFKGGDARTNQHAVLMSLQNLFLRDHNRMADKLKKMNPHWDGEKIYQTARQILGAKMQCIAYKEYLPLLLGGEMMNDYDLWIESGGEYDESLDPTVSVEFSTVGFRIHSMTHTQVGKGGCAQTRLRDIYCDTTTIHRGCAADYLQGTCRTPSQSFDRWFVPDITDFALKNPNGSFGIDLSAVHIQRGRDSGIPAYPDVLKFVTEGAIDISSFNDLWQMHVMSKENANLLKKNYADVRDIDAWIGMQLEYHIDESPLSPMPAVLIADQFRRLKYGDRFFFKNKDHPGSFTRKQIEELTKATLSGMICANTEVNEMPKNALLVPSLLNPVLLCKHIPDINLKFWKER